MTRCMELNSAVGATALGEFDGADEPSANHALTAYTEGADPGAGKVEMQTVHDVPVSTAGRFVGLRVNAAVANCFSNHPQLEFALTQGATVLPLSSQPSDPCTGNHSITVPGIAPVQVTGHDFLWAGSGNAVYTVVGGLTNASVFLPAMDGEPLYGVSVQARLSAADAARSNDEVRSRLAIPRGSRRLMS